VLIDSVCFAVVVLLVSCNHLSNKGQITKPEDLPVNKKTESQNDKSGKSESVPTPSVEARDIKVTRIEPLSSSSSTKINTKLTETVVKEMSRPKTQNVIPKPKAPILDPNPEAVVVANELTAAINRLARVKVPISNSLDGASRDELTSKIDPVHVDSHRSQSRPHTKTSPNEDAGKKIKRETEYAFKKASQLPPFTESRIGLKEEPPAVLSKKNINTDHDPSKASALFFTQRVPFDTPVSSKTNLPQASSSLPSSGYL